MADHGWSILTVLTVCSAGAATPVAGEIHAGEADSTTKVVSVCGLWSAGVAALPFAYPLVFCCVRRFLFPCFEVLIQGTYPSRAVSYISGCCIGVERLHADVFVSQPWAASGFLPRCHLYRRCLFGCGHRACGGHDPASAVCAGWAKCT